MSEVKERPILYSAPMVKAERGGRKTMTRRGITKLLHFGKITELQVSKTTGYDFCFRDREMRLHDVKLDRLLECCPYGRIGDRLWVKEAFAVAKFSLHPEYGDPSYFEWEKEFGDPQKYLNRCAAIFFRADGEDNLPGELTEEKGLWKREIRWRSSLFMPRWASRILLEITNVKIERLQDISDEDATKEGIFNCGHALYTWCEETGDFSTTSTVAFRHLWDSINGKNEAKCWNANPWVWVIEFKRVK